MFLKCFHDIFFWQSCFFANLVHILALDRNTKNYIKLTSFIIIPILIACTLSKLLLVCQSTILTG